MTITASVTGPVTDSDESHAPITERVNVSGVSQKAPHTSLPQKPQIEDYRESAELLWLYQLVSSCCDRLLLTAGSTNGDLLLNFT